LELRFVCGAVIKNITCHVRSRSKELEEGEEIPMHLLY
jgi:hypothetical protein